MSGGPRTTVFPPGPYLLRVEEVSTPRLSKKGNLTRYIRLRIVGTDYDVWWLITDVRQSRWLWEDLVDKYDDLPQLQGRTFLFEMHIEKDLNRDSHWNRVREPLAEVIY